MIEKIDNPMGLSIHQVDLLINELQPTFDNFQNNPVEFLRLDESGISMEITTKSGKSASYNLEQLKKLKKQLSDPVMISRGEIA